MPPGAHDLAGLITAAGASSRMGSPKALLRLPDGRTLAEDQVTRLKAAGCSRVIVVVGADADHVQSQLPTCDTIINPRWREGRLTSIQAGLQALAEYDGVFIMPIDAYGIHPDTFHAVLTAANTESHHAVRPARKGQLGHLLWLSREAADEVRSCSMDGDTPLNKILAERTHMVDVHDPAILHNCNSPDDWERAIAYKLLREPER